MQKEWSNNEDSIRLGYLEQALIQQSRPWLAELLLRLCHKEMAQPGR
jgi:hypothetical protein